MECYIKILTKPNERKLKMTLDEIRYEFFKMLWEAPEYIQMRYMNLMKDLPDSMPKKDWERFMNMIADDLKLAESLN